MMTNYAIFYCNFLLEIFDRIETEQVWIIARINYNTQS